MPPKRPGALSRPWNFYRGNEESLREAMARAEMNRMMRHRGTLYHMARTPIRTWGQTSAGKRFMALAGSMRYHVNRAANNRVSIPWLATKVASYDKHISRGNRRLYKYR